MTKEQAKDKDYVTRQIIKYLRYSRISNVQGILGQVYDIQIPPEQFVTEFEPLLLDDEGEYLMSWYIKVTTSDGIFTIIFGNCYDYRKH